MREDHLLKKKGKFPTSFEWLISSDIVENQNSLSASPEQESQMDPILENVALCFLHTSPWNVWSGGQTEV